jgi:hypothetical protein
MLKKNTLLALLLVVVAATSVNAQSLPNRFTQLGVTFNYPSSYIIADEEYDDGMFTFNCTRMGDDLSIMTMTIIENDLFYNLDTEDMVDACEEGLVSALEELDNGYSDIDLGEMNYLNENGRISVYCNFNAELFDVPIYGKVYMMGKGNKLVGVVLQSESTRYLNELQTIFNSISF